MRATVANLVGGDTTTFSLAAADIDEVEAGIGEPGAISNAVHVQDFAAGGDVYYSVGTFAGDMKTGSAHDDDLERHRDADAWPRPATSVSATRSPTTRTFKAYIKAVLSPSAFVVTTRTGAQPANVGGATVNTITRAFNTIALAESGSTNGTHLGTADLVANNHRLTWICYNDGPLAVAATVTISGYTTDATRYITLTVAGAADTVLGISHRHRGTAGSGVVVEAGVIGGGAPVFDIAQAFTRFEWLEIDGNSLVSQDGIYVSGSGSILRNLIVHDIGANDAVNCDNAVNGCSGVIVAGSTSAVQIRNCFVYDYGQDGITAAGTGTVIANTTHVPHPAVGRGAPGHRRYRHRRERPFA